jgi:hypothetical protein
MADIQFHYDSSSHDWYLTWIKDGIEWITDIRSASDLDDARGSAAEFLRAYRRADEKIQKSLWKRRNS